MLKLKVMFSLFIGTCYLKWYFLLIYSIEVNSTLTDSIEVRSTRSIDGITPVANTTPSDDDNNEIPLPFAIVAPLFALFLLGMMLVNIKSYIVLRKHISL